MSELSEPSKCPPSEETKSKRRIVSPETRAKLSAAHKGRTHSLEHRLRNSLARKGKSFTPETRAKLKLARRGKTPNKGKTHSLEARAKMSLARRGKPKSLEMRARLSATNKGHSHNKGEVRTIEQRARISVGVRESWARMDAKNKKERMHSLWAGRNYSIPNKCEQALDALLQELFPGEYRYCGDSSIFIGGKCPDFINVNGKKQVVELFGDYWHEPGSEPARIAHFKSYGFDCVIIWESELRVFSKDLITQKIEAETGSHSRSDYAVGGLLGGYASRKVMGG